MLEEPPHSDECWATTTACAYPEARVVIMVNSSLPSRAPEVTMLLEKWTFEAADQVATEAWMEENNEPTWERSGTSRTSAMPGEAAAGVG